MLDHIERGNIDFSALKSVVLDEADQMLKQGFKEEVDKVSDFWLWRIHRSQRHLYKITAPKKCLLFYDRS